MRLRLFLLALATLLLAACGSGDAGSSTQPTAAALASLPATLEGKFDTVAGSAESDGSPFYLGNLEAGGEDVGIKVSEAVLAAAGITHGDDMPTSGDGKVRVTLSSKVDIMGGTYYMVSEMQRL